MNRCTRAPRAIVFLAFVASAAITPSAGTIVMEERLVVGCEVLLVENGATRVLDTFRVDAGPKKAGTTMRRLSWPSDDRPTSVGLVLKGTIPEDGSAIPVRLDADVRPSGVEPVRVTRTLGLSEGTTSLVDLYARDRARLVLSCSAERREAPVARRFATAGRPVRFVVDIEWIDGERSVPVESNELNTLVGESVEYYFAFRSTETPESMKLVLTPTEVTDDIVRVVAEVSGTLPTETGPLLVSRRQDLMASRDATSSVGVTTGSPPTGYRFRITPHF